MLEVTGGRFWKPYKDIPKTSGHAGSEATGGDAPIGMSPDLYQYRPPLDLTNPRLRAMATALGPAYVRISGTWANTTYFTDTDTPPKNPPKGYGGVLTRQLAGRHRLFPRRGCTHRHLSADRRGHARTQPGVAAGPDSPLAGLHQGQLAG